MTVCAVGGTFDTIHRGHLDLLERAFAEGDTVIIGLASDSFARRRGKAPSRGYGERLGLLEEALSGYAGRYEIVQLDSEFGPAVLEEDVGVLVVSEETASGGDKLNRLRAGRGVGPVRVVAVPMTLAEDGTRISSSRIRASEMDPEGRLTR